MSADQVVTDPVTGLPRSKRYGDLWVYWPLRYFAGAPHAQPGGKAVSMLACSDFTPDYEVFFDSRGALDAPEGIPCGSVRAVDFEAYRDVKPMRLMVGHVYRNGWNA